MEGEHLTPVLLRESVDKDMYPLPPTRLIEFWKRIEEKGVEMIQKKSIRLNDDLEIIDLSFFLCRFFIFQMILVIQKFTLICLRDWTNWELDKLYLIQ